VLGLSLTMARRWIAAGGVHDGCDRLEERDAKGRGREVEGVVARNAMNFESAFELGELG
jgi:hypothetical protein